MWICAGSFLKKSRDRKPGLPVLVHTINRHRRCEPYGQNRGCQCWSTRSTDTDGASPTVKTGTASAGPHDQPAPTVRALRSKPGLPVLVHTINRHRRCEPYGQNRDCQCWSTRSTDTDGASPT
eukprot:1178675-Prorocentrum_minimum.AAC.1